MAGALQSRLRRRHHQHREPRGRGALHARLSRGYQPHGLCSHDRRRRCLELDSHAHACCLQRHGHLCRRAYRSPRSAPRRPVLRFQPPRSSPHPAGRYVALHHRRHHAYARQRTDVGQRHLQHQPDHQLPLPLLRRRSAAQRRSHAHVYKKGPRPHAPRHRRFNGRRLSLR